MYDIINKKLDEIEKTENVKILYAVESGSRAWGFASPDSDYDVRFVYVRERDFYLRLDKTRDVIEWQLDDVLDINGWDLIKALRLVHNSNPTIFEWSLSPIVYRVSDEWNTVVETMNRYFRSKSGLYHYLSTAKNHYSELLKGDVIKLKKYFYTLRPLLAAKWIIDKNSPPPMSFLTLTQEYLDGEIKAEVEKLISIKVNTPEISEWKHVDVINEYIEENIADISEKLKTIPDEKRDWRELNELFITILNKVYR